MTKESVQLTLTGGYLMHALDSYLTPGREEGFFSEYGRIAFKVNDDGEINPSLHSLFFRDVAAIAIEKGVPGEVFDKLKNEAELRVRQLLDIPGGLERLYQASTAMVQAQNARRRARNN